MSNRSQTEQELPICVDFDYTLTLESVGEIETYPPNLPLIERLRKIKSDLNPVIKIVTARGNRDKLTVEQKEKKYLPKLTAWLAKYNVPYDLISFNKEEGRLFIDDITISETADFSGFISPITGNKILFTEKTVTKMCPTSLMEHRWYRIAERHGIAIPGLRFVNPDCIVTERIWNYHTPKAENIIPVLDKFKEILEIRFSDDFNTYVENIQAIEVDGMSGKVKKMVETVAWNVHQATFFHGDLSTGNILCTAAADFLIDPNCKHIFGSYLTDAGKAAFSLIAYEAQFDEAQKIFDHFWPEACVWTFAVYEGLRVCKYQPKYISIVNNIADLI